MGHDTRTAKLQRLQLFCRFYAGLNDFLPPNRRQVEFSHWINEPASIKDVIESLGVPHPEVDLILVNGESVGFDYLAQDRDRISVYPYFQQLDINALSQVRPSPYPKAQFVLDVHLGKLATYLRLLGWINSLPSPASITTNFPVVNAANRSIGKGHTMTASSS